MLGSAHAAHQKYEGQLRALEHRFPDHAKLNVGDLEFGDNFEVFMTEKDAVKCVQFAEPYHWYLPVEANPDSEFIDKLDRLLGELGADGL